VHSLGRAEDAGSFDLVVVGGGMAGLTSAVAAARLGSKVALIQDRPVLGGNSSSEIRVYPGGNVLLSLNPGLGALEHELDPGTGAEIRLGSGNARSAEVYADEKKVYMVQQEKNIRLFLNTHAIGVEKSGDRITAVIARDVRTGKDLRFAGSLFADCTGDATIGAFAGADFALLATGFIISFFVALASIRFLLAYVRRYSFIPFGIYRILAALAFFLLILH